MKPRNTKLTATHCVCVKPKVKGYYIDARIYKIGRLVRTKIGHKAWINWIY